MGEKMTYGSTAKRTMKANKVGEPVLSKTHTLRAKLVRPELIRETTWPSQVTVKACIPLLRVLRFIRYPARILSPGAGEDERGQDLGNYEISSN